MVQRIRLGRTYELLIGRPVIVSENFFTPIRNPSERIPLQIENFYDPTDTNSYRLTTNNISFNIIKTEETNNKGEITLENVSEELLSYIMDNRENDLALILRAGYVGEVRTIIQGTMRDCYISKNGTTLQVKLEINDGAINTTSALTSRTYPKGTPYQSVIEDLVFDLAVPNGRQIAVPRDLVTPTAFTLFGNSFNYLDKITSQFEYTVSIHDGQCHIVPNNVRFINNAAFLTPTTGLIGTPQKLFVKKKNKSVINSTAGDSNQRYRVTCQLDGSLIPSATVYVRDAVSRIDGAFKIEKVNIDGQLEGGSWQCTLDVVQIEATIEGA